MAHRLSFLWLPCGLFALSLASGCVSAKAPFVPPGGLLYTSVKAPLQVEFSGGGVEYALESGSASTMYFHDPVVTGMNFAWDDCSIQTAAKNGNIRRVDYADYEVFTVLSLIGFTRVHVYGPKAH